MSFLTPLLIQPLQVVADNTTTVLNTTIPQLPVITLANAFGDVTSTLILLVLMIAITVRTYPEYIEKLLKGEVTHFNPKYVATAIVSFLFALPIAMGMMPVGTEIFLTYFGEWGIVGSLLMVGLIGYGMNHGVNKGSSLLGHFFTSRANNKEGPKDPTTTTTETKEVSNP
jgi:hypothetical protein